MEGGGQGEAGGAQGSPAPDRPTRRRGAGGNPGRNGGSNFSIGLAPIVEYASLDLGEGASWNYGFGYQTGIIFKATEHISLGLNYISPRKVDHRNVADIDRDSSLDDLTLQSPQEIGLGVAFTFDKFLIEVDGKWINWSNADGYQDFDWEDQYVLGIGAQYEVIPNLFLRAGYNYGSNPVGKNNGFTCTNLKSVQGKKLPQYYYETFRNHRLSRDR